MEKSLSDVFICECLLTDLYVCINSDVDDSEDDEYDEDDTYTYSHACTCSIQ